MLRVVGHGINGYSIIQGYGVLDGNQELTVWASSQIPSLTLRSDCLRSQPRKYTECCSIRAAGCMTIERCHDEHGQISRCRTNPADRGQKLVRDAERAADEKAMADARQALRNADGTSR